MDPFLLFCQLYYGWNFSPVFIILIRRLPRKKCGKIIWKKHLKWTTSYATYAYLVKSMNIYLLVSMNVFYHVNRKYVVFHLYISMLLVFYSVKRVLYKQSLTVYASSSSMDCFNELYLSIYFDGLSWATSDHIHVPDKIGLTESYIRAMCSNRSSTPSFNVSSLGVVIVRERGWRRARAFNLM